jgi:hypothetical protein
MWRFANIESWEMPVSLIITLVTVSPTTTLYETIAAKKQKQNGEM